MDTKTFSIGRWTLEAARSPKKGAPKLILTAPCPLTLRSFESLWPLLTTNFDVTAVDLPGFGNSPRAPELMAPLAMAKLLEQLLAQVAPEGAHVVATDVGVPAALAYAARADHKLLSLTLSDGPGTSPPLLQPGLRRMVHSSFFRWLYSLSPKVFVHIAARHGYQRVQQPSHLDDAVRAHRRTGILRDTLRYLGAYPAELPVIDEQLSSIEIPTLLLWGEKDVFVPPENAERIGKRIANARVVRLPGAGHFAHEDDPEGFSAALHTFLTVHASGTQ